MKTAKQPKLEDRLKELESMVEQLESGELSIDEAVTIYESGMVLAKDLQKQLTKLESRIAIIGENGEEPFDAQ